MQARPKIVKILVVALIVSLVLVACGGGSTGSTWFNLPSTKVQIQPDGAMQVWGFNVGYFPDPALLQQLQSANIQRLEVRIGYNGIHVYANGEGLPYVAWDETAVNTLQTILPELPNVPNANLIATALPWLRTIGLGVLLNIPPADLEIARWNGETAITPTTAEPTIGPIVIGSLTFDASGAASIEGIPVSTLEQALGQPIPLAMDPATVTLLASLGIEDVQVHIQPNGIDLMLGDDPLPGIAWDAQHLEVLGRYLPAFVTDPATLASINQVLPLLTTADITVAVSFTGEQTVATELPTINVTVNPDGSVELLGIPLATTTVPTDVVASLQASNVQQLAVSLQPDGLYLAANGEPLPTITWTDATLPTVTQVAGVAMGNEELLNSVVDIALNIGPNLKINIPPAEGAEAIDIPEEIDYTMTPTEANPQGATLRLTMAVDEAGNVTSLGGIAAAALAQLGVSLPTMPADTVARLTEAGVGEVQVTTDPGALNVQFDGNDIISINYDEASLNTALDLAAPFLTESLLEKPAVNQLIREQIVPLIPSANVTLSFDLP